MTGIRIHASDGSRREVASLAVGNRIRRPRSRASVRVVALVVALAGSLVVTVPSATPPAVAATRHLPPRAGGYFHSLGAGAKLPTGKWCAGHIHRSLWEPRRQNTTQNHYVVRQPVHLPNNSGFNHAWQVKYKPRITGNFRGTTDEIIQWASCKWGFGDDLTRARSVVESTWRQSTNGDFESRSSGHCTPGYRGNPCPTSFGLLQSRWYYRPGTYPGTKKSTAFMVDSALAETRGCVDGMMWFGSQSRGDVWGCVGVWFSGSYRSGYGSYVSHVKSVVRSKPWRRWPG